MPSSGSNQWTMRSSHVVKEWKLQEKAAAGDAAMRRGTTAARKLDVSIVGGWIASDCEKGKRK